MALKLQSSAIQPCARRSCLRRACCAPRASLSHNAPAPQSQGKKTPNGLSLDRRQALFLASGLLATTASGSPASAETAAVKGKEKETIVNDPIALKAQIEAQYKQWEAGQFDAWVAGQPDTIKWQTTYNGTALKLKGRAGAQEYFARLTSALQLDSYKPLAIFVDNDGDEATVVVEAAGASKATQAPFKTILLHMYTIGPMGQVIKFKEMTDTALLSELIPLGALPPPAGAATAPASAVAPAATKPTKAPK